jgi:hypothetical protein
MERNSGGTAKRQATVDQSANQENHWRFQHHLGGLLFSKEAGSGLEACKESRQLGLPRTHPTQEYTPDHVQGPRERDRRAAAQS